MTEEKLNALFQEMNQEVIETVPNDLLNWIKKDTTKKSNYNKLKIGFLIVGVLTILGILMYSMTDKSKSKKELNQHETNLKKQENPIGTTTNGANFYQKNNLKQPVSSLEFSGDVKTEQQLIMNQDSLTEFKIGQLAFRKLTREHPAILYDEIMKSSSSAFTLLNPFQPKNGAIMDSTLKFLNALVMLDSIKSYRSVRQFFMDDRTSYLYMYDDYIVLSYRYRGANFFRSGKAYETGELLVDGKQIQIVGFQCDNRYTTAHFGQRFYLGIGTNDDGTREIIIFNYLWAPSTIIKGHNATVQEKDQLTKLSNAQKNL